METRPTSSDHGPVDALAEEFLARHRRGERPAVAEYAERHPEWADEIREVFPALLMMEQFKPAPDDLTGSHPALPVATGRLPDRLGEYRILREVGRGGMGVVYEAVQEPLGRHVALKVLPWQGRMDSAQIERFRLEASSAARLHHTNIVPVFGVGEHEGVHYYSMQFIHGTGLDVVLQDLRRLREEKPPADPARGPGEALTVSVAVAHGLLDGPAAGPTASRGEASTEISPASEAGVVADQASPQAVPDRSGLSDPSQAHYYRSVARIGVQVAEALAYAHAHGVLHRDIKPSNLLLDAGGQTWVTDFGLAKLEGSEGPTRTGDIVGTLRYMAPERFAGRSDPRSDVYGLSVTLYELLTLRPAFDDGDRARLIDRVLHEPATPPRRLDPHVPRDLETIVLKAMAKDPADRYATARELAEDLRRFRDDRPILSRRARLPERAWRWCRRNPVVAALLALAAGLTIAVAAISTAAALRLGEKNQAIGRQLSQIKGQRDRINADLVRIRRAEADAQQKLFESLTAQARAGRFSGRAGRRFDSLDALARAAQLGRELRLPAERLAALRDEAIACLALPDLKRVHDWEESALANLALDGDFQRYARYAPDGRLSIHQVSDGAELLCLTTESGPIGGMCFSPDGRYLITDRWVDGPVQVWDLERRAVVVDEMGNESGTPQSFSPDSRRFVTARPGGDVIIYDLPSGRIASRWEVPGLTRMPTFSPDGSRVAYIARTYTENPSVQVRDAASGAVLKDFPLPAAEEVFWNPDGATLGIRRAEKWLDLRDVDTGSLKLSIDSRTGGLHFAFHPTGRLVATTGWSGKLRMWDTRTGQELLDVPAGHAIRPVFCRDGRMVATRGVDGRPGLWQLAADAEYRRLSPIRPAEGDYQPFVPAVHPNGRLLAVPVGGQAVELWDLVDARLLASVSVSPTRYLFFTPTGDLWMNSPGGVLRCEIQAEGPAGSSIRFGPPVPTSVPGSFDGFAQSRDGRVVAVSQYGAGAAVWLTDRAMPGPALQPHDDVRFVDVSPDGRWVATGRHGGADVSVKVWDARDGRPVKQWDLGTSSTVRFSPDGRWLVTNGGGCRLWEVGTWRAGPMIGGNGLGFAPDGRFLVVEAGTGFLRLVDPSSGRDLARLEDPAQARAGAVAFSTDGTRLIATGEDSKLIHTWDLRAIRRHLAAMGLDWDAPPYPEPAPASHDAPPLTLTSPDPGSVPGRR
jgi:serine/threonine protein kinase/WD40 repeat protein